MKIMKNASFYLIFVASVVLASCGSKQPAVATPAPVTNAAEDAPATEAATSLEESPDGPGGEDKYKMPKPATSLEESPDGPGGEDKYKMPKPATSSAGSACAQAGGSCVSQMATVACASQPPKLCAAAEICCVMATSK